jgi:hypothetical protein
MQAEGPSPTAGAGITTLDHYLTGRKQLIAGREVLFSVARMYMRPGQRPDARLLGDSLADSPAREISEDEWVANAARGYLTILENPGKGRTFRICVLQQGHELRIGVRMLQVPAENAQFPSLSRVLGTFTAPAVQRRLRRGELFVDWHFPAEHLYTDAQAMEDAVFRISALFESALQALTK